MPLFPAKKLETIAALPAILREVTADGTAVRWYRGLGSTSFKLIPSIARPPNTIESEPALIKRFRQNAYAVMEPPIPTDEWAWLFLMQHFGAATRLLDWTENPLVAVYFAVTDPTTTTADACLWCLDPAELNKRACVQPDGVGHFPYFGIDKDVDAYLTEPVQAAKPSRPPAAGLAPRAFRRIAAQAGVFTVFHRDLTPLEDSDAGKDKLGAIVIPSAAKKQLSSELGMFGINRLALFPELASVALHAMGAVT